MNIDTIILLFASILFAVLAWVWHHDDHTKFDLTELVIDSKTKRVSLAKIGQMLALLTSTWVLIHETRAGRLTEWLFFLYMLTWSGANLARKWIDKPKGANGGGTNQ